MLILMVIHEFISLPLSAELVRLKETIPVMFPFFILITKYKNSFNQENVQINTENRHIF